MSTKIGHMNYIKYGRKYYEKNREKLNLQSKLYYEKNKLKLREKAKIRKRLRRLKLKQKKAELN